MWPEEQKEKTEKEIKALEILGINRSINMQIIEIAIGEREERKSSLEDSWNFP